MSQYAHETKSFQTPAPRFPVARPRSGPAASRAGGVSHRMQDIRLGTDPAGAGPQHPGSGGALPTAVQAKMEAAFGQDFADVRVHEGPDAAQIGALAYTQGTDLHFAPGRYDPHSLGGQQLLGHELAHVVQQRQGRVQSPQAKRDGPAPINSDGGLEAEADAMGARAAHGQSARVQGAGTGIQRKTGVIQCFRPSSVMDGYDAIDASPVIDGYDTIPAPPPVMNGSDAIAASAPQPRPAARKAFSDQALRAKGPAPLPPGQYGTQVPAPTPGYGVQVLAPAPGYGAQIPAAAPGYGVQVAAPDAPKPQTGRAQRTTISEDRIRAKGAAPRPPGLDAPPPAPVVPQAAPVAPLTPTQQNAEEMRQFRASLASPENQQKEAAQARASLAYGAALGDDPLEPSGDAYAGRKYALDTAKIEAETETGLKARRENVNSADGGRAPLPVPTRDPASYTGVDRLPQYLGEEKALPITGIDTFGRTVAETEGGWKRAFNATNSSQVRTRQFTDMDRAAAQVYPGGETDAFGARPLVRADGSLVDTTGATGGAFGGGSHADKEIAVTGMQGQTYAVDPKARIVDDTQENIHHSSPTNGGRLAGAGEQKVTGGVLKELSDVSGHYQPKPANTADMVNEYERQGASMIDTGLVDHPDFPDGPTPANTRAQVSVSYTKKLDDMAATPHPSPRRFGPQANYEPQYRAGARGLTMDFERFSQTGGNLPQIALKGQAMDKLERWGDKAGVDTSPDESGVDTTDYGAAILDRRRAKREGRGVEPEDDAPIAAAPNWSEAQLQMAQAKGWRLNGSTFDDDEGFTIWHDEAMQHLGEPAGAAP